MKKNYTLILIALFLSLNVFSQGPWTFTNDNEIWESTGTAANVTAGPTYSTLTVNGAGNPRIITSTANINANDVNTVNITIQNNTANERLQFVYNTAGTNRFTSIVITPNDTEFKTYTFTCDNNAEWTGTVNDAFFMFRTSAASSQNAQDGDIYIDHIEFSTTVLNVNSVDFKNDSKISVFPNPVKDNLTINSEVAINTVEIYNILGKKVLSDKNVLNNTLNIESLSKGIYLLKLYSDNEIIALKKVVKE